MPDSIKFSAAASPLLIFVVLLLTLSGCAATPEEPSATSAPDDLLGMPPAGAFYQAGKLLLQYGTEQKPISLGAVWQVDERSTATQDYYTAIIEPITDDVPSPEVLKRNWQTVTLFSYAQWKSLVQTLLEKSVSADSETGTLVTVQGIDFVLNRDKHGALKIYRLENKPAGLPITRSISEEAFSAHANAYLRDTLAAKGAAAGPVMFVVGEDELGGAFVLFDPARNLSVFIAQTASPLPLDQHLGYAFRLVDALTLRSHLFGTLKNPFSVTGRLLWLTAQTGAVLVPRGNGIAGEPPAAIADRAGMDPALWEKHLNQIIGQDVYRGSMKPLIDGEVFFTALVQAIQEARESIDIRLYIFDSDDYALRIADLLKQRSREIKVRVLVDHLGSMAAGQVPSKSPYYSSRAKPLSIAQYLRENSSIEVRSASNPWLTSDHTKVIVIDQGKAYLGGMNIGREYRYEWHDMMVEVEGPIVGRLQKDFDRGWAYAGAGGDLAYAVASSKAEQFSGPVEQADYIDIRPLYTRTGNTQILDAQVAAIRRATSHIYIEQPYISDDGIISELIAARRRGVDVRVIVPTRNDSSFMHSANLLSTRAFISNGIRVYGYPGMTHVKAAIYDGWACVGSANFDKLSLRINQETNLATSDVRFVEQLRKDLFEADFKRSREWTEAEPVSWSDYISEFIADHL